MLNRERKTVGVGSVEGIAKQNLVTEREEAHLCILPLDPVEDGLVRGIGEATLDPGLLVVLEPLTQPFRAVVEGISKRFVDSLERVAAGHENLRRRLSARGLGVVGRDLSTRLTRSNAVEHARGWVATKTGLFDMVKCLKHDRSYVSSVLSQVYNEVYLYIKKARMDRKSSAGV